MYTHLLIEQFLIPAILYTLLIFYVGFFALHAIQRISDPEERAFWAIMIIWFNLLGATVYLFTKYRQFKKIGKGSLIFSKQKPGNFFSMASWKSDLSDFKKMFTLTEAEKN